MSDPVHHLRRRRRPLRGLAAACVLLGGASAGHTALAQDGGPVGDDLFGTYSATARANGLQATYDAENLFPVSPVFQLTVPEALASLGSGPTGYGLASLAYPGPLIADIGTVIALTQEDAPEVPPYPVRQEAYFPSGPTHGQEGSENGPRMAVDTTPSSSEAVAHWAAGDAHPVVTAANVSTRARTEVVDGDLVSRARAEVTDVVVLGGVLTIDSVVTDLVAVHDGDAGGSTGRSRASGVRFLGLDASLTREGLLLDEAPAAPAESSGDPADGSGEREGPLADMGSPLADAAAPLGEAVAPLNDALQEIVAQATPAVDDLLAEAGITVRLLQPSESLAPGSASRTAGGVSIDFRYEGRERDELVALVNSVPPDLRQSLGPLPNPVNLLIENHLMGVALAPASVTAGAAPLFEVDIPGFVPAPDPPAVPLDAVHGGAVPGSSPGASDVPTGSAPAIGGALSDFDTSLPGTTRVERRTPGQPPSGSGPGAMSAVPARTQPLAAILSGAVPAFAALLLAALSPFFGAGSRKLADAALAPAGRSCPLGRDLPEAPTRSEP